MNLLNFRIEKLHESTIFANTSARVVQISSIYEEEKTGTKSSETVFSNFDNSRFTVSKLTDATFSVPDLRVDGKSTSKLGMKLQAYIRLGD